MMVSAPWEREAIVAGPDDTEIFTSPESAAWAKMEPASKTTMRASRPYFDKKPASLATKEYAMLIAGPATPTIIESAERTETGQASNNANTRKPAGKVIVVLFIHSPVGFRTFHFSMYEEDGMMHGCGHRPIPHTNYRPNFNRLARLQQLRQNPATPRVVGERGLQKRNHIANYVLR